MSHVVDRLLAQLPGLHGASAEFTPARSSVATQARTISSSSSVNPPTVTGLWCRVALIVTLAIMMLAWPYFRDCGLPLFGYLSAVLALLAAGAWITVMSWQLRSAAAHTVSLLLLLWGLVLAASEILPRTGYAAASASWQCRAPAAGPSWMRWFAGPES